MSVRDLPAQIPRIQISGGSILKPGARGSQQVIMFVEIVDNADIEASAVDAINGIITAKVCYGSLALAKKFLRTMHNKSVFG
jgi:hypothetical protein